MINIGTKENPVLVPDEALKPQEEVGREFWEGVASGSVVLEEKDLTKLLELTENE